MRFYDSNNLIRRLKLDFLIVTIKHKWFVLIACLFKVRGVPIWNAIVHDLSKLSTSEYSGYQRHFYGDKKNPQAFDRAWFHHKAHNSHHW